MSELSTIDEYRVIRQHVQKAYGLYFSDDKRGRVNEVIKARMLELGVKSVGKYEEIIKSPSRGASESSHLGALLTVGETHFFRHADHWRVFEECVLPWIEAGTAADPRRLKIWSAGCSTGEEAYTAAIVMLRRAGMRSRLDVEIIGTDINPAATAAASCGIYTEHSFRGTPEEIKREYFEDIGNGAYQPIAAVRSLVRFRELNLLEANAAKEMRDIDVIFCRNVLIYFDEASVQKTTEIFQQCLKPGGYLFLGHAEGARHITGKFATVQIGETFIHKAIPSEQRGVTLHVETAEDEIQRDESAQLRLEKYLKASKTAALKSDPGEQAVVDADHAMSLETLRRSAIERLCAESHEDARKTFEKALMRAPDDVDSLLGMALVMADKHESAAAAQYCEQALRTAPLSAEAHCTMALVHESKGEHAEARRNLERAIYLDDGFSIAHFRLAGLHSRAGRLESAKREYRNTLTALSNDDDQRVRLYSGGFSREVVARTCAQILGIEAPQFAASDAACDGGAA